MAETRGAMQAEVAQLKQQLAEAIAAAEHEKAELLAQMAGDTQAAEKAGKRHPKLTAAPAPLSAASLCLYLVVWVGAARSLGVALSADGTVAPPLALTILMCTVYGVESLIALVFGRSTMASWRRVDFWLHHVPYAGCVGAALALDLPLFRFYRWTMPLTLLTSLNEAVAAAYALGAPRGVLERPNRLYMLVLMLVLIPVELTEAVRCLFSSPGGPGVLMGTFALTTFAGAAYHALGVVPVCWKRVMGDTATDFADKAV